MVMTTGKGPAILYLSFNDGSDTRVNKEVTSLIGSGAQVDFLGLGATRKHCFVAGSGLREFYFITGRRRSVRALLSYFSRAARLLVGRRYHSVHVINEPQLIILWPLLWLQKHVVVDLFDSLFLRNNLPGNRWAWLKACLYLPAETILVTDSNRFGLSADLVKRKTLILPNYPLPYIGERIRRHDRALTILYSGALGQNRGTGIISGLLETGNPIRILMAGWISDKATGRLTSHPDVQWLGILNQHEVLGIAATRADFILCLYAPVNHNNIHASPNKVFDGIQVEKPVIINAETSIARFVEYHSTGIVIPSFEVEDFESLYRDLLAFREKFIPNKIIKEELTWNRAEKILKNAHNL